MPAGLRILIFSVPLIMIGCGGGSSPVSPSASPAAATASASAFSIPCASMNNVVLVNVGACPTASSSATANAPGSPTPASPVPAVSQAPPGTSPAACSSAGPTTSDTFTWGAISWVKSDNAANGSDFNLGWRGDHAVINGCAQLVLTIDNENGACPRACSGRPYAGGELQSSLTYAYGTYQVTTVGLALHAKAA